MTRKEIKAHVAYEMGKMGVPPAWSEDELDAVVCANHGRMLLGLPCLMQSG